MRTYRDLPGDGGSDILGQVLEQRRRLAERLEGVRRVIAVASGKGGVGKSTVAAGLALALARRGSRTAILDADLASPSVPRLVGAGGQRARLEEDGMVPPEGALGVACMSTAAFLGAAPLRFEGPQDDAFTWRATAEATTLRQLLASTAWGERDWLVVDLPPGADRLPDLRGLMPRPWSSIVVTLASPLSLASVHRGIELAREHGVPLAGLVENMAPRPCGRCGSTEALFGPPGAVEAFGRAQGLPLLAAVPFDPDLALAGDDGASLDSVDSPARRALDHLAARLVEDLERPT